MSHNWYERVQKVLSAETIALGHLSALSEEVWQDAVAILNERSGKIVVTGVGKSGYVAGKFSATLNSLGKQSVFVHPVEALHGDSGSVSDGDVLIAYSYSGTTKEIIRFVQHAASIAKIHIIAITGNSDSELGMLANAVIPINIEEEGCPLNLAPMASTTTMLAAGDALAAALTSPEAFTPRDFVRYHPLGSLGLSLTPVETKMYESKEITVRDTLPLQTLLEQMTKVGKGVLGVVDKEGKLIGSVTDGDVRRLLMQRESIEGVLTSDLMNMEPKSIGIGKNLKDALGLMEENKITNLFVLDDAELPVGIIHIHDILAE